MLELKVKKGSYTDSTGNVIEYNQYYVEVYGIEIVLKPVDSTSKKLLNLYIEKGGK